MGYDFTTLVSRRNTGSTKWNAMYTDNPNVPEDVVPLSVADMELKNPPQIGRGLAEYLQSAILGYTDPTDRFYDAVRRWQKRRNGWEIQREWIVDYPGVVPAFFHLTKFLTQPGDGVILLTPVYYPFYEAVRNCGRTLTESALLYQRGTYAIDFDDLEAKARDPKNKLLLFCSPHNPVGRLWTEEELRRVGQICLENGVRIISDEIHSDLILTRERHHIPMASLSDELARITVTCAAPSKSFNLAAMITSYLVIPDEAADSEDLQNGANVATRILGFVNAPSLMQRAVAKCLDAKADVPYYDRNRNALYQGLKELGFSCIKPEGAFYLFVKSPVEDEKVFCEAAKKYHILIVPGSSFACPGYVRIAYCVAYETILNSMPGFEKLAEEFGLKK